jgi:hypothetical protein
MAMNQIRVATAYTYTAPGDRTVSVTPGTWPVGNGHGAVPLAAAEHGVAHGYASDASEAAPAPSRSQGGEGRH